MAEIMLVKGDPVRCHCNHLVARAARDIGLQDTIDASDFLFEPGQERKNGDPAVCKLCETPLIYNMLKAA